MKKPKQERKEKTLEERHEENKRNWIVEYREDTLVAYCPERIKKIMVYRDKKMYEIDLDNKLSPEKIHKIRKNKLGYYISALPSSPVFKDVDTLLKWANQNKVTITRER